jgi:uroporphyrin-III C-methyltransferase
MLFGRAQEEIAALDAAGIQCEVVPGITAALAAAAELKTSLTQRGSARSVAFATPRVGAGEQASRWADGITAADAGAIYMGIGEAAAIAATLLAAGKPRSLPVAVVANASLPNQSIRYTTLAALPALADAGITGPALILLGPQFAARAVVATDVDAARCRRSMKVASG